MNVNFRTILGKTYTITVQPNQTLTDAKRILSVQEDISLEKAQFIYRAEILQENIPFSTLQIQQDRYIVIHNSSPKKATPIQPPPVENNPPNSELDSFEPPNQATRPPLDNIIDESDEFNRDVKALVEMGFTKEQAIQALRTTGNNLDSAISLLVSENAPIPEEILAMNNSPSQQPPPNTRPPPTVESSNSGQNTGRYRDFQGDYDKLSSSEKEALERLDTLGFDPTTTIQIFIVCGKDEEQARNCLSSLR
ncbi:UBA/TS-N domain containing protein [Trichomonas vaginalis G3]|uniref:UV excision repair protein RAD23 n=1 Tax=Trichomonas vaginalis (strain ATCC PRA-98 / G3) TaxID=412133 RepID=A2ETT4_TRIV3|nr:UV excision repair protein RAD23 family [Trichomonas vaginalis G3]EAY03965.1 UBA/TS-N domain containing protein [Trichomonas vaginalis G3]KAI5541017.1 UV excision repair protein RAD23 family [Trichomonas vaginalis G3]|eukprot:XP_001316188.1 UBA/TS-N domain containing protein [Trichomonas vaginalis G3]